MSAEPHSGAPDHANRELEAAGLPVPGRPPKEPPADLEFIKRLAAVLPLERIGFVLGVGASTFYRWLQENEELRVAYEEGRARMEAAMGLGIIRKAMDEGNLDAMKFYLRTKCGWVDPDTRRPEGEEGTPDGKVPLPAFRRLTQEGEQLYALERKGDNEIAAVPEEELIRYEGGGCFSSPHYEGTVKGKRAALEKAIAAVQERGREEGPS